MQAQKAEQEQEQKKSKKTKIKIKQSRGCDIKICKQNLHKRKAADRLLSWQADRDSSMPDPENVP
jgi:hypothetical protein